MKPNQGSFRGIKFIYLGCTMTTLILSAGKSFGIAAPGNPDVPPRSGLSLSMFVDLNEGDTRAAAKSYALLLGSDRVDILTDATDPNINPAREGLAVQKRLRSDTSSRSTGSQTTSKDQ